MKRITFIVPGQPKGQDRHRTRVVKTKSGKTFAQNYDTAESRSHKALIQAHAARALAGRHMLEGPLYCEVTAIFICPKTHHRKTIPAPRIPHTSKPDGDNLAKAVTDACSGVLFLDDAQVADWRIRKIRGAQGEAPRTEITFREIGEDQQ